MGRKRARTSPESGARESPAERRPGGRSPGAGKKKDGALSRSAAAGHSLVVLTAAVLVLANLAVYGQTLRFDYVNFDDDVHLFKNPRMRAGLDPENLTWALTTFQSANWIPLTWLSHLLDFSLFGANPG
ncbi:MAG: hypothetical protein ACREDF_04490, partial [Thermoplasmata archaeon]